MSKFKVGDVVVIVKEEWGFLPIGTIATVYSEEGPGTVVGVDVPKHRPEYYKIKDKPYSWCVSVESITHASKLAKVLK